MKRSGICPKCQSTHIIADAKAIDRGHFDAERDLSVATFRKPDAIIFKGQASTSLSAWVCNGCGYVEFYADSPRNLSDSSG